MAGYCNYSMSNNAVAAYNRGMLPASKAAKEWGFKSAIALRACLRPGEWHHTSKRFNCTDFFDVEETIGDLTWQELARWKQHLTRNGWEKIKSIIREKLAAQMMEPDRIALGNRKPRTARLMELNEKFPTPYQRRNGLPAVQALLRDKELTEKNYLTAKAEVDARRNKSQP